MCKIIGRRKVEFDRYTSSLLDLKSDLNFAAHGRCICNIDFSLYYPYFWYPRSRGTFSDQIRLNMFDSYVKNHAISGMDFVFSRVTILEMLMSVHSRVMYYGKTRNNDEAIDTQRRKIDKLLSNLSDATVSELDDARKQGIISTELSSASQYAKELAVCYADIPNNDNFKNIDLTIDLLNKNVITSFYDHFGYDSIASLRLEINELTDKLKQKFITPISQIKRNNSSEVDIETKEIAKHVDCRNIATSIIINKKYPDTGVNFTGAPYNVRDEDYFDVKRSHFVPAFWMTILEDTNNFESGRVLADKALAESVACKKIIDQYNSFENLPDFAIRTLGDFLYSYIDPMQKGPHKNDIPIEQMKARLAGDNTSKDAFKKKYEEAEEEFLTKARELVGSLSIDEEILEDTGLSDNPRAKQIMKTLGL